MSTIKYMTFRDISNESYLQYVKCMQPYNMFESSNSK